MGDLSLAPVTVKDATRWCVTVHRHLRRELAGARFAVALEDETGARRGVAIVTSGPRVWEGSGRCNIARVGTDGVHNGCSMLYAAICRAARALGYREAWTYTLPSEPGTSLRAAGFEDMGVTAGGEHDRPRQAGRRRRAAEQAGPKRRWRRVLLRAALRSTESAPGVGYSREKSEALWGPYPPSSHSTSTASPEPEGGGRAGAQVNPSLARRLGRAAPEEAATLPKRALRPLTGDALKDACRRLSPPPALEDMDIATPEEAATGTPECPGCGERHGWRCDDGRERRCRACGTVIPDPATDPEPRQEPERVVVEVSRRPNDEGTISFDAPGFTTVRICRVCGVLINGGPTLCMACARLPENKQPAPARPPENGAPAPEEAATGTCQKCDGTTLVIDSAGEPADCTACNNGRAPVLRREGERTGIRPEGGPSEGKWIEGTSGKEEKTP